jgi:hypothetical protein
MDKITKHIQLHNPTYIHVADSIDSIVQADHN